MRILAIVLLLASCDRSASKRSPQAPRVTLSSNTGKTATFSVEVVVSRQDRNLGLMYRKSLDAASGMLFIFPNEDVQSFWMKNTYIPLDMIFIDENLSVVGVVHNAVPETTTSRKVASPSKYVLEINGGIAQKLGVDASWKIRIDNYSLP